MCGGPPSPPYADPVDTFLDFIDSFCASRVQIAGFPSMLLRASNPPVWMGARSIWNLEEYIDAVVAATVAGGVLPLMHAFSSGFQQVFPLTSIRLFNEEELETLICGCGEQWTVESLKENIKFDHGYTASSLPLQQFLQILAELGPDDQVRGGVPVTAFCSPQVLSPNTSMRGRRIRRSSECKPPSCASCALQRGWESNHTTSVERSRGFENLSMRYASLTCR